MNRGAIAIAIGVLALVAIGWGASAVHLFGRTLVHDASSAADSADKHTRKIRPENLDRVAIDLPPTRESLGVQSAEVGSAPRPESHGAETLPQYLGSPDELENLLYGQPEEWPPDARGQDERTVSITMEQALRDCDMGEALVYANCSEPPCIAIIEEPEERFKPWELGKCDTWTSMYGAHVSTSWKSIECEDGPIQLQMVAANIPGWGEEDADPDIVEMRRERVQRRFEMLASSFCDRLK